MKSFLVWEIIFIYRFALVVLFFSKKPICSKYQLSVTEQQQLAVMVSVRTRPTAEANFCRCYEKRTLLCAYRVVSKPMLHQQWIAC